MENIPLENNCNIMVGDEGPCFYKIIRCQTMEEMQIPPEFMKHLSNQLGDKAIVKGPSDDVWTIAVHKKNNVTYLQDGWQDFMRYHSLGNNELLLFHYDGNFHFSVQIFDENGLKRKSGSVTFKHREARELEAESSVGRRKRGRPRKNDVNPNNLHQSKSCKDGEDGAGLSFPSHKLPRVKQFKTIEHTTRKIKEEELEPTNVIADPLLKMNDKEKHNSERKKEKGKTHEKSHSENIKHAKRKIKEEEMELTINSQTTWSEKEDSFTSNFPFYKCCLTQTGVQTIFLLPIPRPFSQAHFPPFRTHVVLRNSKGNGWVVNVIPVAGRHSFSGGWRSFVVDNGLKEGDVCIFELVKRSEMQVHVYRAGKKLSLLSEM